MSDYAILENGEVRVVGLLEWAAWNEAGIDRRRVALTEILPEVRVSTVFLGLNHGFGGPDLWFETLVFGGPLDGEMDRYTTLVGAKAGHQAMVERVQVAIREQMEMSGPS